MLGNTFVFNAPNDILLPPWIPSHPPSNLGAHCPKIRTQFLTTISSVHISLFLSTTQISGVFPKRLCKGVSNQIWSDVPWKMNRMRFSTRARIYLPFTDFGFVDIFYNMARMNVYLVSIYYTKCGWWRWSLTTGWRWHFSLTHTEPWKSEHLKVIALTGYMQMLRRNQSVRWCTNKMGCCGTGSNCVGSMYWQGQTDGGHIQPFGKDVGNHLINYCLRKFLRDLVEYD